MQNFGDEYFFTSDIEIGNTIDDAVNCRIDYRPQPDGTVKAEVTLLNSAYKPLPKCSFRYTTVIGGQGREKFAVTDSDGRFDFTFTPQYGDRPTLELQSQDEDHPYRKVFDIPLFDENFDVQFFPEGGALLSGPIAACRLQGHRQRRTGRGCVRRHI